MASKIRRIYTYTNQQGKEQTILINGTSSKDTDKKFQAFLAGVAAIPQAETPTLTQFINDTFRPGFMEGLCETTIANYERYIRLYIGPFMGQMKMREITVATIQTFYNWLAADSAAGQKRELNRCTIERISGLTSRIFKVALEMGIVEDTPFKKTILRIRAHRGGHHKALPDAEVSRIKREIPALRDERQRLYMALLVYTGMRREEVLGLGWENIHLEEGYGEVKRVVVYPNNGRAVVREGAKTEASERTFLIPDALREILLPHRREHGYLIHGETEDNPASYFPAKNLLRRVQGAGHLPQIRQPRLAGHLRHTTKGAGNEQCFGSGFTVARRYPHGGNRLCPQAAGGHFETPAGSRITERFSVEKKTRKCTFTAPALLLQRVET